MGEFEEKLNAVLSDPQAMAQIANLAQSLNLGRMEENAPKQEKAAPPSAPPLENGGEPGELLGNLSGLSSLLGQVDPNLIRRLLPLVGELTDPHSSDSRLQLLMALRPFLKEERQSKVERALQAAKLLHAGKKLLSAMGESYV